MRKQLLAMAFVVAMAVAVQSGCNRAVGPSGGSVGPVPASVVVFGGDAPLCSILSFTVTVTGMTLTPGGGSVGGGSNPVSVLPSGQSVTLDFASLMDFTAMLTFSDVPAKTYTQLNLTLANPQLTYWDTSQNPPAPTTITPILSSLAVTLDLNPAVAVASKDVVGLQLEFDLLKSVLTDSTTGQITGKVTPTFTVGQATASSDTGFAELEDVSGMVQDIKTSSTNSSFVGSLTVQPSTGSALTINVTSSTTLDGVTGLSALTAGTFVEVDAFIDSGGNVVAKEVNAEEQEDAASGKAALRGLITSVTRNASGNATQFNLYVREESPDVGAIVPLRSVLSVNVGSSTGFVVAAQQDNFTSFPFNPTTLGVGQLVTLHAQLPTTGGSTHTADARSIYLGLQSVLGNLSTAAGAHIVRGQDGKSGGFTLVPCSPVFQSNPITVLTFPQTAFAGITDLSGLTTTQPLPFLLIKGLVFYEQQTGTVNTLRWTPPANVQVAAQVHQLQ